jgi:hypothetical protein
MVSEKTNRVLVAAIQCGHHIKLSPIRWDPLKYGVNLDYGRPLFKVSFLGKTFLIHPVDIIRLSYLFLTILAITYLAVFVFFLEHTTTDACIAFVLSVAAVMGFTAQAIFLFMLEEFSVTINHFYNLDNDMRKLEFRVSLSDPFKQC